MISHLLGKFIPRQIDLQFTFANKKNKKLIIIFSIADSSVQAHLPVHPTNMVISSGTVN